MCRLKTCWVSVFIWFSTAVLAGCGANLQPNSVTPGAMPAHSDAVGYKVLHHFGREDGFPRAGLIAWDGKLYGTTGGSAGAGTFGTVFEFDPRHQNVRVLYRFKGPPDGSVPTGDLVVCKIDVLCGTTRYGGANGLGAVFKVGLDGSESLLHSFEGGASHDGETPDSPLLDFYGRFYGTTLGGGSGFGVVFEIDLAGKERVVHAFDKADGWEPEAGLIAVSDKMYGTTLRGGEYNQGTVFRIDESGVEQVLHSFGGSDRLDGASPRASGPGLVAIGRDLYGTTTLGGRPGGSGTLFTLSTTGDTYRVVHFFDQSEKGLYPAGIIAQQDYLYGMTTRGGPNGGLAGTIFKIRPSGLFFSVLHDFDGRDGERPDSELVPFEDGLFGTTTRGGTDAAGVLFELSPYV